MLNFFWRMMRNRKGFTLIELMVVVVIIGVLATIGVQTFSGTTEKAKKAKAQADIRTIMSALELYKVDIGEYPESGTGKPGLNALTTSTGDSKWKGPYLSKLPKDPYSTDGSADYKYDRTSQTAYTLTTANNEVTASGL
jgi:general secretion pathway protein G